MQMTKPTHAPRISRRRLEVLARWAGGSLCLLLAITTVACAPGQLSGENAFPSGTSDPATVQNAEGALAFYHHVTASVGSWLDPLVIETGILTDELADAPLPIFDMATYTNLDSRTDLTGYGDRHYNALHNLRAQAREARGFATSYLPEDVGAPVRGHLYALEAYAEILLADLFCSGIPLSTVDYQGDYTLAAGSTTKQVYAHAAALLDTALTLLGPNDSVRPLATVGQGRALLALGDYAGAAQAVAAVPTAYRYEVTYGGDAVQPELLQFFTDLSTRAKGVPGVAEQEGGNGLAYRSSVDPRVPVVLLGDASTPTHMYFPAKYPQDGTVTYRLADGIEARLIEAEAALQGQLPGGPDWLTILNTLRTDGSSEERQTTDDPPATYTFWHRGTGGVDSLAPLDDPGTPEARVDLVFRERAFWLYLTGHRQGDLRRLLRPPYGRSQEQVYPTGSYAGVGGDYGTEFMFPVPKSEARLNPRYTGCVPGDL